MPHLSQFMPGDYAKTNICLLLPTVSVIIRDGTDRTEDLPRVRDPVRYLAQRVEIELEGGDRHL